MLSLHPHDVLPVKCLHVLYDASTTCFFAESSTAQLGPPSMTFKFRQSDPLQHETKYQTLCCRQFLKHSVSYRWNCNQIFCNQPYNTRCSCQKMNRRRRMHRKMKSGSTRGLSGCRNTYFESKCLKCSHLWEPKGRQRKQIHA